MIIGSMHLQHGPSLWPARLATFLVWALVAASLVYWWLHSRAVPSWLPPAETTASAAAVAPDSAWVARALGAPGSAPDSAPTPVPDTELARRLRLLGVVVRQAGGTALITVDDKPPRPVLVGQAVGDLDDGWVLHAVSAHGATLARDAARVVLELPPMAERSRAGDAVASRTDARQPPGVPRRQPRPIVDADVQRALEAAAASASRR